MIRDALIVLLMAAVALCGGLAINAFREVPLPWVYAPPAERIRAAAARLAKGELPQAASTKPRQIEIAEFRGVVGASASERSHGIKEGQARWIILDARPEVFYQLGHVPGALSLPREDFEAGYGRLRELLEKDPSRPIAVYCADMSCEDSELVAGALTQLGFLHVAVFKGGWEAWSEAHLPQEKGVPRP